MPDGLGAVRSFEMGEDSFGLRFDQALSRILGLSRSQAARLIADGQARVEGRSVPKSGQILPGDFILVSSAGSTAGPSGVRIFAGSQTSKDEKAAGPNQAEASLPIVYEDDDLVVVDKPAGMASHPAAGWAGPTVVEALQALDKDLSRVDSDIRPGIVSRLDAGTSGLMLVCKSDRAFVAMKEQFARHQVKKTYQTLVQGHIAQDRATVEAPIARQTGASSFRFAISPDGKPAITHWDVLERLPGATLLSINLETGRTHQIRVHLSSLGHPLIGDTLYGANPRLAEELGLNRQWLHSIRLEFTHPVDGRTIHLESPLPDDLSHALEVLRGSGNTPSAY